MAAISVAVVVVTGLVQSVRLVGSPIDLLDANHGRNLTAQIMSPSPPSAGQIETGAPLDARFTSILHDVVTTPERPPR